MHKITADTDLATIPKDTPLRLSLAAQIAFPGGGMTASSLRREHAKGHLVIERYAGKDFVTLAAIEDMRKRCRVDPKELVSGSGQQAATTRPAPIRPQHGLSETERLRVARDALLMTLGEPSKPSPASSSSRRTARGRV